MASGLAIASTFAAPIIPTTDGTTWPYLMTQEAGEGLGFSGKSPETQSKMQVPVVYRISGRQALDGKDLLKFEMHRGGMVTNADLLSVDDKGMKCLGRIDSSGEMTKLDPPQIMIAAPLKEGASWDYDARIGETKVHQHYAVTGEEDVDLAAGKFHAFKIHGEQTSPSVMIIDRWFVSGTGIVKDVTTMRDADGAMRRRITLELKERPKVAPRPAVNDKKLSVTIGKEAVGPGAAEFGPATQKIYARWRGNGLRAEAKIRAVWIAEDIGEVADPDYMIDEATTNATAPDSHGIFTLARPEDGWAPGVYRVEVYVDDALVDTAKLKILK
ncbi:MAG: hypothetical protein ABJB69_00800 [Spartobacteria bacterium]